MQLYTCLMEQHDLPVVLLAAILCCVGAHATFVLLNLARESPPWQARAWMAVAAVTTATATWATHFVGMLAYQAAAPVGYDVGRTLLSLAVPCAINLVAFPAACRPGRSMDTLCAGLLVGLGITAMHYIGMSAYSVAGSLLWDSTLLPASVTLGTILPALAFRVGLRGRDGLRQFAASAILVAGICLLHFLGMAALVILPDPEASTLPAALRPGWLAAGVGLGALVVLAAALAAAARTQQVQRRERESVARMRNLVDATIEGLLVCEGTAIVAANANAQALLGRTEASLAGRPLAEVVAHPAALAALLGSTGSTQQLDIALAHGEAGPVELVSRPVSYDGRPHHVVALRDLRERRRAEEQIRFLAHHDPLTRLPNRVSFGEHVGRALHAHGRTGEPFAVLTLDLDRFKIVNDTLGHPVGDALLEKVAGRLRGAVRANDVVARLGGDEFSVLQLAPGQPGAATALAERLVELLSRPFVVNGQLLNIGASVGIALCPGDGRDLPTLLRNADLALYRAKSEGRGTYRFFEPEMDSRMQRRRVLELELRAALATRQFHLLYQPQLDSGSQAVTGFEALVRWNHPERGVVSPAEFIPLAEETGLIVPLGEWVLREACREAAGWEVPVSVAVNLSPLQFRAAGLVETVRAACRNAGLDPRRLELEITESALLTDSDAVATMLRELKELGVRISMDDFGTGYSSLSYLRRFPFDKIKIDRSFIADVTKGGEAAAIVRAIIGLGRSLGLETTVEGVETKGQMDYVTAEGCTQVQGYLVGRPLPPDQARSLMTQRRAA